VHVSEITWANTPINAKEFFKLGNEHEAKVVTLDKDARKMSLSIKQLTEDPWNNIETKYPDGSKHTGVVKNITPYGVFVELGARYRRYDTYQRPKLAETFQSSR
jgi:small subunit ribosomal protein S1